MLDVTSRVPSPLALDAVAGEAGNDDVEDAEDAVDYGFEDGAYAVDDGHDAGSD